MQTLDEFINTNTGKADVGNTQDNRGQCVGLDSVWMDNLGIPHEWGNAIDLLKNADPNYFDVVYNKLGDTSQFPPDGAIVVLGKPYGLVNGVYYGHTGLSINSDGNTLRLFEQNDPEGSTPHMKEYGYEACIGWLIPKIAVPTIDTDTIRRNNAIYNSTQYDQVCAMLSLPPQDNLGKDAPFEEVKQKFDDKNNQIQRLQNDLKTAKQQAIDASQAATKAHEEDLQTIQDGIDAEHKVTELEQTISLFVNQLGLPAGSDDKTIADAITELKKPHDQVAQEAKDTIKYARLNKLIEGFFDWLKVGINMFIRRKFSK